MTDVKWVPNADKIAIKLLNTEDQEIYWIYDLNFNQKTKLNENIKEIAWSPKGNKIAYIYQTDEKTNINIANFDGSNWQEIKEVEETAKDIFWLANDTLAYTYLDQNYESNINLIELNGNGINKINISKEQIYPNKIKFSPNGEKVAYTLLNNDTLELNILDLDNSQNHQKITDINSDEFIWLQNSKDIIYISSNVNNSMSDSLEYKILKYNTTNNASKEISIFNETYDNYPEYILSDSQNIYLIINNILYRMQNEK